MDYLKKQNTHERDQYISFKEESHTYTIHGLSDYTSVTTWNHSWFEPFKAGLIIHRMMKSKNWASSKYFGMTPEEIKTLWNSNGREAAKSGTIMHENIEKFYNQCEVHDDSVEFQYFMNFHQDHSALTAYRTEWTIYDDELKLAGTIDMVFKDENGDLHIYDWKRCKEIKKTPFGNKSSTNPIIDHLPDANFWHYSLQLNTYQGLLERNYNVHVKDLYLICMHPDNKNKSYLKIKVPNLQTEIALLFEERKKNIMNNT